MKPTFFLTVLCLSLLVSVCAFGGDNLLHDSDFSNAGQAGSPWRVAVDKEGQIAPAKTAAGQASALHVKAATLTQQVTLPEGLFELTVEALGKGNLVLGVEGAGDRTQSLGKTEGLYGYLFQTDAGAHTVTIHIPMEGMVSNAGIQPATDAQKMAWDNAQKSLEQFGFITVSPQRPSPTAAPLQFTGNVKPLTAMTKFAVLDEPRMDLSHVKNVDRLVDWLGDNGFVRLNGPKLSAWMADRIKQGDAYGSVVVLDRGIVPIQLFEGPENDPQWLQYLQSGGRIVNAGSIPFLYNESPTDKAPDFDPLERKLNLIGMAQTMSSPYWGQGELPVTATPQARAWGLKLADSPARGTPIEDTSIAFHVYTVPSLSKQGATDWFRNLNPDMPWSGLVGIQQEFNGNNNVALSDVWHAAHYVGQSVSVPPLPPPPVAPAPAKLSLEASAGGMTGRDEFVRGEKVAINVVAAPSLGASAVRLELTDPAAPAAGKPLQSEEHSLVDGKAAFTLDTAPYADGEYQLTATALADGNAVETAPEKIGIRYLPPEGFDFEIWNAAETNPLQTEMQFADIRDAGMELYLTEIDVAGVNAAVRNHLGFSIRAMPDFLAKGQTVTFEKNPEYYRLDNEGKPIPSVYSGGRPTLGISQPEILQNVRQSVETTVKAVADLPSFRPYVLCNDDYSIYYGWDYSPHVLDAFKADTGLIAPREEILPAKFGPIPDNNPWVSWFKWTLIHITGAFNKAETAGAIAARPDVRIGPIPGGMQTPLVVLLKGPAEYPPYNFGKYGFNLICSYYYDMYWQPSLATTFWMEIGRMGNRDLPEWNLPDSYMTAGYTRNRFFLYLAGGVKGLAYYTYFTRNANSWPEFKHLGGIVQRIGNVQMGLQPAPRDIGMLNSFTSNCFNKGLETLIQTYGYENLMQGHFSVDMVSEDEILAGRASQYKAIVLYDVKYLRQSVYDALAKYAANGGLVLLDQSVPFDIPGAKRLPVDLGMGTEKTLPVPAAGAHMATPGPRDYGHADRIKLIAKAVSEYVKPQFESSDIQVVATPFEAGGVPYTWFVNLQNNKEYIFCRERMGAGVPGSGTPEKIKEVRDWEKSEMAKGPYVTTVNYTSVPGVPYDLVSGKKLPLVQTAPDNYALTVSMERFGGALVAWYPSEITGVTLSANKTAAPNHVVHIVATVMGQNKPIPGIVPVRFTLRDPQGHESIVSGVRGSKDGVAIFDWTPAINDPVGTWTLQVTELASGKTAQTQIALSP